MKQFAQLVDELDATSKTNAKVAAVVRYFASVPDEDKLWCIALLTGKRPKRTINTTLMRLWAAELGMVEPWLFETCYHTVGDLAETIAILLPPPTAPEPIGLSQVMMTLIILEKADEDTKKATLVGLWQRTEPDERFVLNKLITGGFRIGVSEKLVIKALSQYLGKEADLLTHRLMGKWEPTKTTFDRLLLDENAADALSRPYPFMLAYPLEQSVDTLGPITDWQAEWKWDGIRCQIIVRQGQLFVWSRGEELLTDKFPELLGLKDGLPDGTVIDGELLGFQDGKPLPFQALQTRIMRKNVSAKHQKECPIRILAYDVLEQEGRDLRDQPLKVRRQILESLLDQARVDAVMDLSPVVAFESWEMLSSLRDQSRDYVAEGFMLKRHDSQYETGRKKGSWHKWKVDPYTIDAVMLYAQAGHGRRANLFTDFTFAVWDGDLLVPFAKAYSGLTDKELVEVDAFVKKNTKEKFGPVRSVNPELVFELAFEGINKSTRHKCGVAVRFPRIVRWRRDKLPTQADTLDMLKLLASQTSEPAIADNQLG